jgi:hypothetical protein
MESVRDSAIMGATIDQLIPRFTVMIYTILIPMGILIFTRIERNAKLTGEIYEV